MLSVLPTIDRALAKTSRSGKKPVGEALRVAASTPVLRRALIVAAIVAVFGRSYPQLLPIFADDVLHVGAHGYGLLLGAGGAGALVAAVSVAALPAIEKRDLVSTVSALVLSCAVASLALSRSLVLSLASVTVAGIAGTVFTTMVATSIQLAVPPALRGRVTSLYVITLVGLPSIGGLVLANVSASLAGTNRSFGVRTATLAGVGCVVLAAIAVLAQPRRTVSSAPAD